MNFDDRIREQLENHQPARPADAWNRFAQNLEESQNDDQHIDNLVKTKLNHLQPGYQSGHWQLLKSCLEKQSRRMFDIHVSKTLEASLLFLLLLTLWNGFQTDPIQHPIQDQPTQDAKPQTIPPLMAYGESSSDQVLFVPDPSASSLYHGSKKIPTGKSVIRKSSGAEKRLPFINSNQAVISLVENSLPIGIMPQVVEANSKNSSTNDPGTGYSVPSYLDFLPVTLNQAISNPETDIQSLLNLQQPVKRFYHRVSMAIRGDIQYIMTPYDHLLSKRGYDQFASSYGGAIGYSWEGQKWGIRTQLGYRHMFYLPKPYTEVFDGDVQRGYFTESIRNIELNMLSVSLHASRIMSRTGRWQVYTLAGATCNFAFQANYDRKQQFLPGADPLVPGEIPQPSHPSKTSQKKYADGLFEGGSLEENYYISLDMGIGLETNLTDRMSLFIEPVYQHNPFRKSLGPNQDRINTLSVLLGTRILL